MEFGNFALATDEKKRFKSFLLGWNKNKEIKDNRVKKKILLMSQNGSNK
jgi:hypothetical protein